MRRPWIWIGLAAAACAALAAAPGAVATRGGATVHHTGKAGVATRVAATFSASRASATQPTHGARRIPRTLGSGQSVIAAPRAAGNGLTSSTSALLSNFNGVSSRDSAVTNFGLQFQPPDQGLCAGNGFVVEMVNSAYTVYRPNGSVVTGPFNVNGPFDEGLVEFTSDPRCYYDASTHTWFATISFINSTSTASHLDIAVNTSGDPTKIWKNYQIDTTGKTGPGHAGCPCFGDQPTLGIDAYNLYVTTNEFSILGPQFNGAQIYAIAKSDLVALSPTPHFVHFDKLSIGGTLAVSVQPALTTGSPPAEYFLNSLDPNGTFDQRLGVWALTNRAAVAKGGVPTLSSLVITSEAYGVPPKAQQRGSTSLIDSGDDRMQQTQSIGGNVWGQLDTAVTIPNDPTQRAGAAWFKVHPTIAGGVLTNATVRAQGYVALRGNYLLYPALQVTPSGAGAMVLSVTGPNRYPSAGYSVLPSGGSSFGDVTIAAGGSTNYDPNGTRWGDYAWAVLDPSGTSVWMATEYMPPKASQTVDGARNWGTRVLRVAP